MPRAIFDGREIGKLDFDPSLGTKEEQTAFAAELQAKGGGGSAIEESEGDGGDFAKESE